MDREGQRAEYAAWLRAAAEQRFGAARAQELAQTIEDVAGWTIEVATVPVAAGGGAAPADRSSEPGDAAEGRRSYAAPSSDELGAVPPRGAPRVAVLREVFEGASPEGADMTAHAVKRLAQAGAAVDEAKLPATCR